MKKYKRNIQNLLHICMAILLLCCFSINGVKASTKQARPPYIGNFQAYKEGNNLKCYFSFLNNKKSACLTYSGNAKITIYAIYDKIVDKLFQKTYTVTKNNFRKFTRSGKKFTACLFTIPLTSIKVSNYGSSSIGKITLSFTNSSQKVTYKTLEANLNFLPVYSNDEVEKQDIAQEDFDSNAVDVGIEKYVPKYIIISISRIGIITLGDNEQKYIEVEIYFENLGNKAIESFYPSPLILDKNSKQYNNAHLSTYYYRNVYDEGEDIPAHTVTSGCFLFKIDNKDIYNLKDLIINIGLRKTDPLLTGIGHDTYIIDNNKVEFDFDLSTIKLEQQ